ncbi:hypothetical protein GPALN_004051 [Globodera pallida]|nr:hypothetical protein GPALN_004051 [Globodera pallida]
MKMRTVLSIAESPVGAMPLGAKGRAPTEPPLLDFPAIYLCREGAVSTEGMGKHVWRKWAMAADNIFLPRKSNPSFFLSSSSSPIVHITQFYEIQPVDWSGFFPTLRHEKRVDGNCGRRKRRSAKATVDGTGGRRKWRSTKLVVDGTVGCRKRRSTKLVVDGRRKRSVAESGGRRNWWSTDDENGRLPKAAVDETGGARALVLLTLTGRRQKCSVAGGDTGSRWCTKQGSCRTDGGGLDADFKSGSNFPAVAPKNLWRHFPDELQRVGKGQILWGCSARLRSCVLFGLAFPEGFRGSSAEGRLVHGLQQYVHGRKSGGSKLSQSFGGRHKARSSDECRTEDPRNPNSNNK